IWPVGLNLDPQAKTVTKNSTILSGMVAPLQSAGVAGDYYLDISKNVIYGPKLNATTWATGTNLLGGVVTVNGNKGIKGDQGVQGLPGLTGSAGATGPQ